MYHQFDEFGVINGEGDMSKMSASFRTAIQSLVVKLQNSPPGEYGISAIREEFQFQKRRLYDVVNVLEAIGCCTKRSTDIVFWNGLSNIPKALSKLQEMRCLTDPGADIEDFVPDDKFIAISRFTVAFILCFLALRTRVLNIKRIALFLSRKNGRYKTTLCKLYQISHILEAVGVVQKSVVPGEMRLSDQYFADLDMPETESRGDMTALFSIRSLLVGPTQKPAPETSAVISNRRALFYAETEM
jgi:hypothetical protein